MALSDKIRHDFGRKLLEAEATRRWIEPLTLSHPDADIEDAYAIGQSVTDAKVAAGRVVKGHKIGYTSAVMREAFGATEPDYGTLFDNWFVDEGATIDKTHLNIPWAEIELLFVLKTTLGGPDVNAVDVIRATDFVVPAIEIIDTRFTRDDTPGVVDSISDAAGCGFVVVGGNPRKLTDIDPRKVSGSLLINGELLASGISSTVMGNPINAVAWLARKLHQFGVRMEAGHSILSGSFVAARPIRAGDFVEADFGDDLGRVSFNISR